MSGYKHFAVAGAGTIGKYIIDELLKARVGGTVDRVVVLTRSAEGNDALAAKGAEPIIVDYHTPSSLESALQGIDVLISTLAIPALALQTPLGSAAKAAGVQLFVLSEFGGSSEGHDDGVFPLKNAQREHLTSIGLPWIVFCTGFFSDWFWFQPFLGYDLANGRVEVGGTGDSLVSWTSRVDIARYVVYATTALPPAKLHNRMIKMEGERYTP
ncbi:NAD(P)-binding protein [Calocera viscosa TUFC12733]|uniref:NAD(P)-binding protein n=1 Tax=Calocera viscosa (strain TUFC12733) TaxID=1330018 RepID=A0A167JC07_CALVF|nr:NAD(P)-binding protein [Calocera viscosa TUFC12733]